MSRKALIVFLLVLLPWPGFANGQSSRTGRVTEGLLATRPACPATAKAGDVFGAVDQSPVLTTVCDATLGWVQIAGGIPNTPLAFSATPSFSASLNASYSMILTANVTSSTVTGTPANGNLLSLTLTEDATGGRTFAFPGNFIFTSSFSFVTTANAINELTFKYDGTNWHLVSNSNAGGCTPLGANALQKNNSGVCAGSNETDDGTTFKIAIDSQPKGPNPYIDIRAFGARMISGTTPNTTAGITTGTPTATLAAASTFVNGDGVVIRGAGASITLSTPSAPTVVAGTASTAVGIGQTVANATGATNYQYQIVALTIGRGFTVASTATAITNGPATLGANTVNISSWTRTNQTVTITTSSAHTLVVGSLVNIKVDGVIMGWYNVSTVPDNTHFTVIQGNDTRNSAATAGGSTGQVIWWNCNKITWTPVANAQEYLIYGRTSGSMTFLGVSLPDKTQVNVDALYNVFEDYGSTMTLVPTLPDWLPSTPPVAVKNDDLVTTILSGAGTTTLTLANNASNTIAGAIIKLDNSPNIAAAVAATFTSNQKGVLYIPAAGDINTGFVTNSVLTIAGTSGAIVAVKQAGSLFLGDTLVLGNAVWSGDSQNPISLGTQFSFQKLPLISSGVATPMVYESLSNVLMSYVSISNTSNSSVGLLIDGNGQIPASTLSHVNIGAPSTDFVGHSVVIRNQVNGAGNFNFDFLSMGSGPLISDNSPSPLFVCNNGMAPFTMRNIFLLRRGILLGGSTNGSINSLYEQGSIMPKISLYNPSGGIVPVTLSLDVSIEDTTTNPILSYYGGLSGIVSISSSNGLTGGPNISGPGNVAIQFKGVGANTTLIGQGTATESGVVTGQGLDGTINTSSGQIYPEKIINAGVSIGTPYQLFVNSNAQAAPVAAVSAGGTVALGTYTFQVAPVFANGGEGTASAASNAVTTTGGNQTITITWVTVPGATGYDLYKDGFSFQCSPPWVTGGATTSYVWSGAAACGQSKSGYSGSGPTSLSVVGVSAPQVTFPSTNGGGKVNIAMPTGSATRTITVPDASGAILLDSTTGVIVYSAYDNFNRANGGIGSNWTVPSGTYNVVANAMASISGGNLIGFWNANTFFPDQFAEDTISISGTQGIGAATRGAAGNNWYACIETSTTITLAKDVAGTVTTTLGGGPSAITGAVGDVLRMESIGTTQNCYRNGVLALTAVDSSLTTGQPGIYTGGTNSAIDNWNGGNIHPLAKLDNENDWTQPQHFSSITVGPSNPIPGTLAPNTLYAANAQLGATGTIFTKMNFMDCGTTATCAQTATTTQITLKGGPIALVAGTITVTSLPFASATSYVCSPDDSTGINGIDVVYNSGASVTFNGTGTDSIRYTCVGN